MKSIKYIESYSNNNSTLNYFKSLVKNDTIQISTRMVTDTRNATF
jgi:hypothetical protein